MNTDHQEGLLQRSHYPCKGRRFRIRFLKKLKINLLKYRTLNLYLPKIAQLSLKFYKFNTILRALKQEIQQKIELTIMYVSVINVQHGARLALFIPEQQLTITIQRLFSEMCDVTRRNHNL